jgi:hypothetical protein
MFRRLAKAAPADPPAPESRWRRQVRNIVETQIARYPLLVQLRAIWRQLQDERASWPYLLPVLAVVFIGTYRAERKKLLAQLSELRKQ